MKNWFRVLLLFFFTNIFCYSKNAPVYVLNGFHDGINVSLGSENKVDFSDTLDVTDFFLFHSGDNINWSKTNIDEKGWTHINTGLKTDSLRNLFNGMGWFRMHLKVADSLSNKPIGLKITHWGASQIFINGKHIKSYGTPSLNPIDQIEHNTLFDFFEYTFYKDSVYTIAIKYSNHNYKNYLKKYDERLVGFHISFFDINDSGDLFLRGMYYFSSVFGAIFGILFALALVHLIIFLLNRDRIFNLIQSIFVGSLSLIFLISLIALQSQNTSFTLFLNYYSILLVPLFLTAIIGLLNNLFYNRFNKFFYFLVAATTIIFLLRFIGHRYYALIIAIQFITVYFSANSIAIKAIRRKLRGAKVVGLGVLGFTILIIVGCIMIGLTIAHESTWNEKISWAIVIIIFILAILSLPLSVSIYLAYDFATTNKQLAQQLKNVEDLNKRSLEQEQEKKRILENQNAMLEMQVTERTEEIMTQKEEIEAQRDELENINQLLDNKNHEITDSINYAKRIQQALLPIKEHITEILPDTFILYKPKDIVSGDFYFFHSFENNSSACLLAAVDCTGHGVPGAFTSVVGVEKLHDAVDLIDFDNENYTGNLLQQLNKGVKTTLRQSGADGESRDGMDIALLYFDNLKLLFSGANRPLWIVRNKVVIEYKSTKSAIGGLTEVDQVFETHSIHLQKGDTLYIFSDGYADQFGGEHGKKMMTKKFREKLLEIQNLNMAQQESELNNFYEHWRGRNEQIDDVLVIGIRI